jgi:hypothetical protein
MKPKAMAQDEEKEASPEGQKSHRRAHKVRPLCDTTSLVGTSVGMTVGETAIGGEVKAPAFSGATSSAREVVVGVNGNEDVGEAKSCGSISRL